MGEIDSLFIEKSRKEFLIIFNPHRLKKKKPTGIVMLIYKAHIPIDFTNVFRLGILDVVLEINHLRPRPWLVV